MFINTDSVFSTDFEVVSLNLKVTSGCIVLGVSSETVAIHSLHCNMDSATYRLDEQNPVAIGYPQVIWGFLAQDYPLSPTYVQD